MMENGGASVHAGSAKGEESVANRSVYAAPAFGAASGRGGGRMNSNLTTLSPTELDTYAQWAWLSGRIGEAVELYTDLARLYRRSPHVHFKLGFLYLVLNDPEGAVHHFTEEINRYSDDILDLVTSSTGSPPKNQQGRPSNLAQQRAFMFCTYAGRREAYILMRDSVKADADQLFISNRGGHTKPILLAMGCLFFRFGMFQRADDCYERCCAMDGADPNYLVEHGELRLAQRRYANAAWMFEKCRQHCSSSSPVYHRALIGEGTALMRQSKLQDAVILLLQAMNTLRNTIRATQSSTGSSDSKTETKDPMLTELVHLYHHATNLYGGLCLMKGELKAALDTYCSVLQDSALFNDIAGFRLPTMCVVPGTKNQHGEVIDTTKLSTKNLSEAVRHLSEMEWRYGPDVHLYFHRANLHRALGELESFVQDLSLVESMDPEYLAHYKQQEGSGDFLDVETISWIPVSFVQAIHDALERNEYRIPTGSLGSTASTVVSAASPTRQKNNRAVATTTLKQVCFSDSAMHKYFRDRIKNHRTRDDYAEVFQVDIYRRLPEAKRRSGINSVGFDLAPWEGAILDEWDKEGDTAISQDHPMREMIKTLLATHGRNPGAHMVAGMFELEVFNATLAHTHFTDAIVLIEQSMAPATVEVLAAISQSSLAHQWQRYVLQRMKYYCLIWRSVTSRVKIEMERAVEDLNLAAAIQLTEKQNGSDDPFILVQRALIMFLNGHLKSAYKLLRQLKRRLRVGKRQRMDGRTAQNNDLAEVIDMFSNAGLNTFHLFPVQVYDELKLMFGNQERLKTTSGTSTIDEEENDRLDKEEEQREEREEEEAAISMVKYALTKKSMSQNEMLDKFFESGVIKLSSNGSISQVIPYFQAILSIDEGYLPPANFASLELFKCREHEFMEEKLFNCFVRLGKRSKWLHKKVKWKFEALIDVNLAHAYLPSDMETLWHRARLLADQKNFVSAIRDLTDCLQLMTAHFTWERGKKEVVLFNNETKKTQWLQLLLERGTLFMQLHKWENAIDDLTMVIAQAGKTNKLLTSGAYEARSTCLVRLKRYGHAIQDLQHLLGLTKEATKPKKKADAEDLRQKEDHLFHLLLVANLYCQLALDHMRVSSSVAEKNTAFNPLTLQQLSITHINQGFITRAITYFDEAEAMAPEHFLVHYFRGRMLALSGQPQKATQSLTEALRLHPMFLPALFLRGCIYAQQNLLVLALADFYRVRHRVTSYPHLHTTIGYCHFQRGSMTKAVETLTEAIVYAKDDVDAMFMRGCALQELMVLENAIKDFDRIISIRPDHFQAYYQKAVCLTLLQNYTLAIRDMDKVIQLQPEWKDAWVLHAYVCFCDSRFELAVHSYGQAIGLPDSRTSRDDEKSARADSKLFFYRAVANMHATMFVAALEDLDLAIKRDNENYVAFIAKAFCLTRLGDKKKAGDVLAHCLPYHREISLVPAEDVRNQESSQQCSPSPVPGMMSFLPSSSPPKAQLTSPSSPTRSFATADTLFHHRREVRDREPKQSVRSIHSVSLYERRTSTIISTSRRTSTDASSVLSPAKSRRSSVDHSGGLVSGKTRRLSILPNGLPITSDEEKAKLALRNKFLRVMKKLTFQHRVLKALEHATTSKYKKNQQLSRMVADLLYPVSKVAWPRGTLTTRLLVWAFNTIGIQHLREQKIDEALMAFTLAIQAHPSSSGTYFNRANAFLQMQVLPSAISGFQDAIELDESCHRSHNNMGMAYYKLNRYDEAQEAFSTGLHHAEQADARAVLLYNLGVVFQALDRPDEALDFYQQAIALDATRTEFFNNRSAILHQQMRYAVALEDYNRALKLQSTAQVTEDGPSTEELEMSSGVEARLNRAQLYITVGNCTLAIQDLSVALRVLEKSHTRQHVLQLPNESAKVTESPERQADEVLATELLTFCLKWRSAMRIAVKDFLTALHTFPCFAVYELSPLFGPELSRLHDEERHHGHDYDDTATQRCQLDVISLPIQDLSFFEYQREFDHWVVDGTAPEECPELDREPQEVVRNTKREQWQRAYAEDLHDALRCTQVDEYDSAARYLLRAHYKTTLDSHDEYLLMTWRIQVTLQFQSPEDEEEGSFGLSKAIVLLREFLEERRSAQEFAHVDDDGGNCRSTHPGKARPTIRNKVGLDDGDDECEGEWTHQRKIIRADLYTLLGSLYQLNGQQDEAKTSLTHALFLRADHIIALLNYLQLCVTTGEYEVALDAMIRLLDTFLSHASTPPTIESRIPRGLLGADRSIHTMIPEIRHAFANSELHDLGSQMLTVLKEYRSLLSAQIQSSTPQVFKKQGIIAHLVHEVRSLLSLDAESLRKKREQSATTRQLETLNQTLDKYQARILQAPAEDADDAELDAFYADFQVQFADICEIVARSLPSEESDYDTENEFTIETGQIAIEEEPSIEEFLASIRRREEIGRRKSGQQGRSITSPRGSLLSSPRGSFISSSRGSIVSTPRGSFISTSRGSIAMPSDSQPDISLATSLRRESKFLAAPPERPKSVPHTVTHAKSEQKG